MSKYKEIANQIWSEVLAKSNTERQGKDIAIEAMCQLAEEVEKSKQKAHTKAIMRFYLVSFNGEGSGSIWFNYDGFPSHLWIKERITQKFPQVKTPAIMHIQELSEKDYNAFNGY